MEFRALFAADLLPPNNGYQSIPSLIAGANQPVSNWISNVEIVFCHESGIVVLAVQASQALDSGKTADS